MCIFFFGFIYFVLKVSSENVICSIHYVILNTKHGKGKGKLLLKIEEISRGKTHTKTRKLIQNILMITDFFLDQKRVNFCEHTIKITSHENF